MKPIVAVIGRPNVGKSTLFNRITKKKEAIVDDFPGVTRDRIHQDTSWDDIPFVLVDTGGFMANDTDDISIQIRFQVQQAMDEADVIVLVLDGKSGPSPFDMELTNLLRAVSKPVLYVVNKIDGMEKEDRLYEFCQLGIETPLPVSAAHGYGIHDFMDTLISVLPKNETDEDENVIRLAVVGKPNVGKSSIINKILGEDRLLVSDVPGTTRDSVDTIIQINDQVYSIVDTAGIRRKKKVSQKLEKFSILKALKSLDRCDVALIMIDAFEGITEQDIKIAGYALERKCGCIFLLNKWDMVEKDTHTQKKYFEKLKHEAKFLHYAPIMTVSAKTGQRVKKIFKLVDEVYKQISTRVGTGQINSIISKAVEKNEPPIHSGRRLKYYYTTQVKVRPPTFVLFVNIPEAVHFSYKRYLANQIRQATGLDKTPLELLFRPRKNRKTYK